VAPVIGDAAYSRAALANPVNDAKPMAVQGFAASLRQRHVCGMVRELDR